MTIAIGDPAPAFELPDTDGARHALAWHDRLLAVARDYADRGVRVLAICSNDSGRYPRDSYEAMQERVRAEGPWPMPYLRDEDQEVARAYGALTTPDVFVIAPDGTVAYRGAPDADSGDPSLDAAWLREALDDVLAGRPVRRAQTKPVGCSIKWRA